MNLIERSLLIKTYALKCYKSWTNQRKLFSCSKFELEQINMHILLIYLTLQSCSSEIMTCHKSDIGTFHTNFGYRTFLRQLVYLDLCAYANANV